MNLLEKELSLQKEQIISHEDPASSGLKEVKQLLISAGIEDTQIMRQMAPKSLLIANEHKFGKTIELENFDKEYAGNVYLEEQIKQLCIDYNLRFLNSTLFTGFMAVEVISKIKEFANDTHTPIDAHTQKTRFYILAPAESFTLTEDVVVKEVINRDPIIFYKIDDTHYRLIYKWGKDFTILRRIQGWKWKNPTNRRHFSFLTALPFVALVFSFAFPVFFVTNLIWSFVLISAFSYAFASARTGICYAKDPFDYIEGFFTPNNWNSSRKTVKG